MNRVLLYLYSTIFILFCLLTYLFIDPNFIYLKFLYSGFYLHNRLITTIVYFSFVIAFFVLYIKILSSKRFTPHRKDAGFTNLTNFKNYKFVFVIPAIGIFTYPAALSFDLFNYIASAKVAFHYFENPYIVMPIAFLGDPILLFTRAANKIALYGPLWVSLTSIPYYLSFGNYLVSIVLFKLFISLFFFGIIWLLWRMTKSVLSVVYFAASPLVLIETFVSGHNDVVMMFFALLSVYSLKNKRIGFSILFLTASILIKFATIFLLPVMLYGIYQILKGRQVDWDRFYLICFVSMLFIFLASPIREELYSWYAIWPITFLALTTRDLLKKLYAVFTFGLLLGYLPYMFFGTYSGTTPIARNLLIIAPIFLFSIYLWSKKYFRLHS